MDHESCVFQKNILPKIVMSFKKSLHTLKLALQHYSSMGGYFIMLSLIYSYYYIKIKYLLGNRGKIGICLSTKCQKIKMKQISIYWLFKPNHSQISTTWSWENLGSKHLSPPYSGVFPSGTNNGVSWIHRQLRWVADDDIFKFAIN